jgi:hypothetical protein
VFLSIIFLLLYVSCCLGICLDPEGENHQVDERVATLERVLSDTSTFWSSACHHSVVVRL